MRTSFFIGLLALSFQLLGQKENASQSMYFRSQPIWLFTHKTIPFEIEYFFTQKHSLSFEYTFSGYNKDKKDLICFSCWLSDNSKQRHLVTLNYRYYIKYGFFISPYLRYRKWEGDLSSYVQETLINQLEEKEIQSNSLGAGLTIGARGLISKQIDISLLFGLGGYFYNSYELDGYTINDWLELDYRFGVNIGVKIFDFVKNDIQHQIKPTNIN